MWTFETFPKSVVKQKYGVDVTDAWLERLQKSVVRLEGGCTGSFVSGTGLVLTNHHCAASCIADNSSADRDLVSKGFVAETREGEARCENQQISVLMATEDVTAQVRKALLRVAPDQLAAARNKILTTLEQGCEEQAAKSGAPLKCETVTLYKGGQYALYKYKRYEDLRLVFAPEKDIAAFGGDPDNFQFPRWCLDMSLLRVYENGKPATTPSHLAFNWNGAKEGEPVFVAGHPGTTSRLLTVSQLEAQRDVYLPFWLLRYSELRGRLIQYGKTSPEAERTADDVLGSIENSIKVRRMQLSSLLENELIEQKTAEETKLKQAIKADKTLEARSGMAWEEIARAQQVYRDVVVPYTFLEGSAGFNSDLFDFARVLVRAAEERGKPNSERLRGYTDAALPALKQRVSAAAPVYPELEKVRLSFSLERMREWLGPDDPVVKQILGKESPDERAKALVEGSALADPKKRMALYEGGSAAIAASDDPMIQLARLVDQPSRALRLKIENEVDAPTERAQQAIAEARFKVFGTRLYPDATFTLRLSYGAVEGWLEKAQPVSPFTTLARLYERATGAPPFALPPSWIDARPRLDMNTRANFVTTNDIIGGNSGSPMVNAAGEIVGLVFDGNIHSISGSYWFDAKKNRTVAVHPGFIRAALEKVYRADALASELGLQIKAESSR
jgi:V8-like Glu-specific endopeptidase